ncbi:MAG: ATP-dependent zinc metalloprotease FtsH [Candidatus Omnitrophota bacterium]|nr:ATP-dependent zinc metalloprotease FtsH [Candidatus Omnitrophota bacterium]
MANTIPKFKKNKNQRRITWGWIIAAIIILYLLIGTSNPLSGIPKDIKYSVFYGILKNNPRNIKMLFKTENILQGELNEKISVTTDYGTVESIKYFKVNIPERDDELLSLIKENVQDFDVKLPKTFLSNLLFGFGPIALLVLFYWLIMSRGEQLGNRIMTFGKVRPKIESEKPGEKVTFNDVAGVDEAKEELTEVIEFLKDPKKFQRLGGKIPKGVLLIGPPGTGKTLLAKAVAGEAEVPFYSISGSDFVEMFVGVGASRVRDLFEQGRKAARVSGKGAIIFIDEIDAVGRLRFSGIGGGNDEREQTLNALLVEMDGFNTVQGLILIAATNRPDTLDPALLRPGRFDRTIVVHLPDIMGRGEILKVHTRKLKPASSVDLKSLASQTPGFSGADIANLCNEAALLAARYNKETIEMIDFEKAVERVLMGPEKKSHIMSKKEKQITAIHESGHALLSLILPGVNPLKKVSIIPRGLAGGYTFTPPLEDRHYWSKTELISEITLMLGGRASEELNLKEVTTGAQNDLEMATSMARKMVCQFGMSDKLGHMTLGKREGLVFLGRDLMEERNYSDDTARVIDEEIRSIVDNAYRKAISILQENLGKLKILTDNLIEKEVLDGQEVKKLLEINKSEVA